MAVRAAAFGAFHRVARIPEVAHVRGHLSPTAIVHLLANRCPADQSLTSEIIRIALDPRAR